MSGSPNRFSAARSSPTGAGGPRVWHGETIPCDLGTSSRSRGPSEDQQAPRGAQPPPPPPPPRTDLDYVVGSMLRSGEWRMIVDGVTGRPYYYSVLDGVATWDLATIVRSVLRVEGAARSGSSPRDHQHQSRSPAVIGSPSSGDRDRRRRRSPGLSTAPAMLDLERKFNSVSAEFREYESAHHHQQQHQHHHRGATRSVSPEPIAAHGDTSGGAEPPPDPATSTAPSTPTPANLSACDADVSEHHPPQRASTPKVRTSPVEGARRWRIGSVSSPTATTALSDSYATARTSASVSPAHHHHHGLTRPTGLRHTTPQATGPSFERTWTQELHRREAELQRKREQLRSERETRKDRRVAPSSPLRRTATTPQAPPPPPPPRNLFASPAVEPLSLRPFGSPSTRRAPGSADATRSSSVNGHE